MAQATILLHSMSLDSTFCASKTFFKLEKIYIIKWITFVYLFCKLKLLLQLFLTPQGPSPLFWQKTLKTAISTVKSKKIEFF